MRSALTTFTASTLLMARPTTHTNAMATVKTSSGVSPKDKKAKSMVTLKGIVFDMDDTLVRSNLDIASMYKQVFGRDPDTNTGYDILKEVESIKSPEEKARAYQIIESIEEKSRRKMTLMPGCVELLTYCSIQKIPTALVTRNNRAATSAFCKQLQSLEDMALERCVQDPPALSFKRIITRDDTDETTKLPIPPKPDPTAMKILAKETFECDTSQLLMVGDSISNDLSFGKNAGSKTALLTPVDKQEPSSSAGENVNADLRIARLTELPKNLWSSFFIEGPNGNSPDNNYGKFQRSNPPIPQSELCKAVANSESAKVTSLLGQLSLDEIIKPDENGNTALIWAAETGNVTIARLLLDDVVEKSIPTHDTQRRLATFQNHRGYLGATALNRAARRNHTEILELLLREGDRFDMNLPNSKMQYPLHFVANKKNPESLEYLLMCGANPWVLDRKGRTPLEDSTCETCSNMLRAAMATGGSY